MVSDSGLLASPQLIEDGRRGECEATACSLIIAQNHNHNWAIMCFIYELVINKC